MPKIKQQVTQAVEVAQDAMSKVDMKSVSNKVQKALQFVKQKIENIRKSSQNNEIAIKVNNKEAKQQITQLEKEIDSLQKKINARQMKLDIINPQIDKIVHNTKNEVVPEGISKSDQSMDTVINNALSSNKDFTVLNNQAQRLYSEIELYNKELGEAKSKMSALKQEANQTASSQNKLTTFFSAFKGKIDQAKSSISGLRNNFKQIPQITQNITNNIKKMGGGIKSGIGQILKYATALFSLRGIYSILSNSAQSWLSSQNAGAQQLSANIDYMKYAMGSALAPVIQFVTNLVYQLMKAIQSVAYALTGVNIFTKATAASMNNVAGSAKKAKKEAQGLAGIHDEINNVQTQNNSDSGSGSGSIAPNFDLSEMESTPNSILDAIKNGDWYAVGEIVGEKLNQAMESIPWNKIQDTAKKIGRKTAQFLNGFIETTNWEQVGNTFAQGVNTILYTGYEFITTFNWKKFGTAVADSINGFFKNTDWATLGKTVTSGVQGILDTISSFVAEIDLKEIIISVAKFIINIDLGKLYQSFFNLIGSLIGSLSKAIVNLLGNVWNKIKECFKSWISGSQEQGNNIIEGLLNGMLNPFASIKQWIQEHIFKPFTDGFKNAFGIHSPSTVMFDYGKQIIEGLKNGLSNIWDSVKSIFINLVTNISSKFTEVKNNVINWANNVKSKFSDCWTSISTNVQNKIITIKNNISNGLNNIKTTITNWTGNVKNTFSNIGKNAITWGKDLVSNMASGIKNNISKVTNAVKSVASKIKSLLGFSEPEDGPLSNFHTYMPDMIDLMVKGIHNNMDRVTKELENLTTNMSYTINTPDINPLSINANDINSSVIRPTNIMEEALNDILASSDKNYNITIPLSVIVGNKKLGEILLEDLRNKKRQTGKNIEALVGG